MALAPPRIGSGGQKVVHARTDPSRYRTRASRKGRHLRSSGGGRGTPWGGPLDRPRPAGRDGTPLASRGGCGGADRSAGRRWPRATPQIGGRRRDISRRPGPNGPAWLDSEHPPATLSFRRGGATAPGVTNRDPRTENRGSYPLFRPSLSLGPTHPHRDEDGRVRGSCGKVT